jgi:hypothetical protein
MENWENNVWLVAQNSIWGMPLEGGITGHEVLVKAHKGSSSAYPQFYINSLKVLLLSNGADPKYVENLPGLVQNFLFRVMFDKPFESEENYGRHGIQ